MKRWVHFLAALGAVAALAACGGGDDDAAQAPVPGTLAQEASTRGFTALVAAADKAGLVGALSSTSASLTVFAPTDAAFTALAGRLGFASAAAMVAALDGPTLAKLLQYHVLPTRQQASDLAAGAATRHTLYQFEGAAATLALSTTAGVRITDEVLNQATVTSADVPASNGVIHVIDRVLVPPGVLTVVQMAQANPSFSVLVQAVTSANLAGTLGSAGPFTVFAPSDTAFAAALSELSLTATQLLARPELAAILGYHVVPGDVRAADVAALPKPAAVATVQGGVFTVDATLAITDGRNRRARLAATDIVASNGVIHVVDNVLLPAP
ncbi:MAG: fasciclin domain-containing protein [Betaproteobacteria bacterium]|nr:fasciclin domain-containing protein [Betaproteobacteria bacterium]MCC6248893.1 fasciclin domain-containing protein [Rubrivivax sp.]MCL4697842.1 fasciclin domain-containing protein [Burkholderiaceae bacterium]